MLLGIVPRAIKLIKDKFPTAVVITDVALDPYSSMVRYFTVF
jgi:delta-aminolevulinic acid dehydratase/porphobilinogen synthase